MCDNYYLFTFLCSGNSLACEISGILILLFRSLVMDKRARLVKPNFHFDQDGQIFAYHSFTGGLSLSSISRNGIPIFIQASEHHQRRTRRLLRRDSPTTLHCLVDHRPASLHPQQASIRFLSSANRSKANTVHRSKDKSSRSNTC
jgi:hypothetical protein